MTIVVFIIVLAVLILAHEFGHFIVAKRAGIRVDEFGLGFPPKIIGKKWGETEYSLNWLPLGGFVKIFGETVDDEVNSGIDYQRSLVHKPKKVQAAVLLAGVTFNLILAWLLFSVGFMYGLPTSTQTMDRGLSDTKLLITSVLPGSPAEIAGLKPKDEIIYLEAGGQELRQPTIESVQSFIGEMAVGESLFIGFQRNFNPWRADSKLATTTLKTKAGIIGDRPAVGVTMDEVGILKLSPVQALVEGGKYTVQIFVLTVKAFGNLLVGIFHDGSSALASVTGPVGLVGLVGDARNLGVAYLLGFTALISVNLAVINLVPFPALDGGRLLFLLIEAIRKKPLSPKIANTLNAVGFFLLIALMLVVSYRDIANLFG